MTADFIVSVHKTRVMARLRERKLQRALDQHRMKPSHHARPEGLPYWVRGVKVVKAGSFQWVVMATPTRGH